MRSLVKLMLNSCAVLHSHAEEAGCDRDSDSHKYLERIGLL